MECKQLHKLLLAKMKNKYLEKKYPSVSELNDNGEIVRTTRQIEKDNEDLLWRGCGMN